MKVVTFNVKYSHNLGDGVIAECLETELGRRLSDLTIEAYDLAGRTGREDPAKPGYRIAALAALQRMPAALRDVLVEGLLRLRLRKCRRLWRHALRDADLAIIGGGQLIQDRDLNFPIKLSIVASECRRHNVPISLFGVGVAESHSGRGAFLTSSLLNSDQLVFAGARDGDSAKRLRRRRVKAVAVTPDPGLMASAVWQSAARHCRQRPLVGVGITHPVVLRHHGEDQPDGAAIMDLYRALVRELLVAGYDVTCFSNGAPEDEACLDQIVSSVPDAGDRLKRAPHAKTPQQLAQLIGTLDALVGHRLHACIVAYSYRVVHIGLKWDGKLSAFFANVGRSRYLVDLNDAAVRNMSKLLAAARAETICEVQHRRVLASTSAAIDRLALLICRGVPLRQMECAESALPGMRVSRART